MFDVCWGTHCQVYCPYPFAHFIQLFVKQGRRSDHLNFLACFRCCWLCQWTWGAFLIIYNICTYAYVCWLVGWYIWNSFSLFIFWENLHVYVCWKQLHWTCTFANETRFDFNSCMNVCMYVDLFYVRQNIQTQKSLPKERYNFLNLTRAKDTIHGFCSVSPLSIQEKFAFSTFVETKMLFSSSKWCSFEQISFKRAYNRNSYCSRWKNT